MFSCKREKRNLSEAPIANITAGIRFAFLAMASRKDRQVRTVLVIEGIVNGFVLLAKLSVGLSTGSIALVSDAIHSLTDIANNGIAFAAARISAVPPDRKHPYGHRKFEPLAVFGLATFLTVVAIEVALRALERIDQPIVHSNWGLGVMLGVLAVNLGLASWERSWARRLESELLRADANHTFSDVFTTIGVLAGWQGAARGYAWIDPLCAVVVTGLVFSLAFTLFRRAIPILVDEIVTDPEELCAVVGAVPGVCQVRRIRSRSGGSGTTADVVISVDAALPTAQSHGIANTIERKLSEQFKICDVTVHIEPGRGDDTAKVG